MHVVPLQRSYQRARILDRARSAMTLLAVPRVKADVPGKQAGSAGTGSLAGELRRTQLHAEPGRPGFP